MPASAVGLDRGRISDEVAAMELRCLSSISDKFEVLVPGWRSQHPAYWIRSCLEPVPVKIRSCR